MTPTDLHAAYLEANPHWQINGISLTSDELQLMIEHIFLAGKTQGVTDGVFIYTVYGIGDEYDVQLDYSDDEYY